MKIAHLYKKNSKGVAQEWSMHVEGNTFWAEYGLVGGKIQADTPTICEGKNIGRKNETAPEAQALAEAESKVKKQRDKGYDEVLSDRVFTPMLAHEFKKHGHKLPEEVLSSVKLDGIRSVFFPEGAFSRLNKPLPATKFISDDLVEFFKNNPNVIIDGEIYNHDFKDDFNKISSLVRRTVHFKESHWKEIDKFLQLHIFDFHFKDQPEMPFERRIQLGRDLILEHVNSKRIHFVPQDLIKKSDIDTKHEEYLQEGYEGIMVRDPKSPYQTKRSYFLQKYKNFIDEEFEIIGVEEGKGNWAGKAMKVWFKNNDGDDFKATPKGNEQYRAQLLLDKDEICGKMGTVRYQNRTPRPENKPRFGTMTAVRDYE